MKHTNLISIVMPAYNAAEYIDRTIESVIQQSFKNWELLIVNDCSQDKTAHIIEAYQRSDERIKLINLTVNMGAPAGPRNIGVAHASGDWVAFLDSDDIWYKDKLKIQIDVVKKFGAQFCSTQMIDFKDSETPLLVGSLNDRVERIGYRRLLLKNRIPTSSVLVNKNLLLNYPFNEDIAFKAREDFDCWLHCHEEIGTSVKILAPMMGYRKVDGQISGNKWIMVKRHFHVLKNYRRKNGRLLTKFSAFFFTLTHFSIAMLDLLKEKRI